MHSIQKHFEKNKTTQAAPIYNTSTIFYCIYTWVCNIQNGTKNTPYIRVVWLTKQSLQNCWQNKYALWCMTKKWNENINMKSIWPSTCTYNFNTLTSKHSNTTWQTRIGFSEWVYPYRGYRTLKPYKNSCSNENSLNHSFSHKNKPLQMLYWELEKKLFYICNTGTWGNPAMLMMLNVENLQLIKQQLAVTQQKAKKSLAFLQFYL